MTDAERILHDVLVRVAAQSGALFQLRAFYKRGRMEAWDAFRTDAEANLKVGLAIPEMAQWLGVPRGIPASEIAHDGREAARKSIQQAYMAVQAAELVFYHSCVDGAATDCCRALTVLAPGAAAFPADLLARDRDPGPRRLLAGVCGADVPARGGSAPAGSSSARERPDDWRPPTATV
jgi:hypothetical protein